jgi:hypothetical protein
MIGGRLQRLARRKARVWEMAGQRILALKLPTGGKQFVFNARPHLCPLPHERKLPANDFGFAEDCPTGPAADFSKDAGNGRATSVNLVAADVRRLHLKLKKQGQSLLTSAATVG